MTWYDWSKDPWRDSPAVWVHRGGRDAELEIPFIESGKIGIYWGIENDLSGTASWQELVDIVSKSMTHLTNTRSVASFASMVWSFVFAYRAGDIVIMPRRGTSNVAIGKITSDYAFDKSNELGQLRHYRNVEWLDSEFPKHHLDDDIELRVAAQKTIGRMRIEDGVQRVLGVLGSQASTPSDNAHISSSPQIDQEEPGLDVESLGLEQIADVISQRFKTHKFTALVAAVLEAQGFDTYVSPPGPDKGVDILAGTGPLGLEGPKLCVQVKSGDKAVDRMTLDQLIGTMANFNADHGLFVSWGGFNKNAHREIPAQWFNVRMWKRDDFILELLKVFDLLDESIRSQLPFKQIWTVAYEEEI